MFPPQLSIITINRNNATGLLRTLESIQSQTWRDFELIVIDGASTDDSLKVLERFADMVTVRVSEPDAGIYDAQNKGTRLATGRYCLYLNSGDLLCDHDVLRNAWGANPIEDIVYFDNLLDYGDKLVLGASPPKIREYHFYGHGLWHQSLISRKLFEKYGYYKADYRISGDYEFFLRVVLKYGVTCRHVPITFVRYDTHGISADPKFRKLNKRERRRAWVENFGFVRYFFSFLVLRTMLTYLIKKPMKLSLGSSLYGRLKNSVGR